MAATIETGIKKSTKKKKTGSPEYASYLLRVSKNVHADKSVSKDAMYVVNAIIVDIVTRLISTSNTMAALEQKTTLKAKHVQAAANAVLSGELARHAISAGTKAVLAYERA